MKDLIQNIKVIILSTIVILSVSFVYAAWTDPTANPTGGNTDAPINVSSVSQTKDGPLWANGGLFTLAGGYFGGNVGIGTTNPNGKLQVNGQFKLHSISNTSLIGNMQMEDNLFQVSTPAGKIREFRDNGSVWFYDGATWTQQSPSPSTGGTGKVLTSDANGSASWQTAVSGGGVTTVYDYGTSQSGGTVRPVIVAYGGGIWLGGNQGASISGLPFSSAGSFTCIVTPTTWNGGGGGPYGGGPDQGTGLIGCYKYNGSSVWLGNTDDQGRTVNWFAIGY